MLSRPEGRARLPLENSPRVFLSMLAVTTMLHSEPLEAKVQSQFSHSAETHHIHPKQVPAAEVIGKLVLQSNTHAWQHLRPLATITAKKLSSPNAPGVSPTVYAEYYKVHECEEPERDNSAGVLIGGGWQVRSTSPNAFSGGLGDRNYVYVYYSTHPTNLHYPANAADATIAEQIIVNMRIQEFPPDQNGCLKYGY